MDDKDPYLPDGTYEIGPNGEETLTGSKEEGTDVPACAVLDEEPFTLLEFGSAETAEISWVMGLVEPSAKAVNVIMSDGTKEQANVSGNTFVAVFDPVLRPQSINAEFEGRPEASCKVDAEGRSC
ncbi:MAG: hypothetical protein LH624_16140 [Cryobacterium sp.]|nr:hypothetical protein [Cryobacterium sp.]